MKILAVSTIISWWLVFFAANSVHAEEINYGEDVLSCEWETDSYRQKCKLFKTDLPIKNDYEVVTRIYYEFKNCNEPNAHVTDLEIGIWDEDSKDAKYLLYGKSGYVDVEGTSSYKVFDKDPQNTFYTRLEHACMLIFTAPEVIAPTEKTKLQWKSRRLELISDRANAVLSRDAYEVLVKIKPIYELLDFVVISMAPDANSNDKLFEELKKKITKAECKNSDGTTKECNLLTKVAFSNNDFTPDQKMLFIKLNQYLISNSTSTPNFNDLLSPEDKKTIDELMKTSNVVNNAQENYDHFNRLFEEYNRDISILDGLLKKWNIPIE